MCSSDLEQGRAATEKAVVNLVRTSNKEFGEQLVKIFAQLSLQVKAQKTFVKSIEELQNTSIKEIAALKIEITRGEERRAASEESVAKQLSAISEKFNVAFGILACGFIILAACIRSEERRGGKEGRCR